MRSRCSKSLTADEERWNAAEKLRANNRSTFSVIDDGEDTDLDVPLAQPINPRILFDDPTYEGLVRYLEFSQPSIGLISDEGGKVVGGYSMSPQNQVATAAAYSSLWDGRDINKIRAGSSSISLANRRMSLHLSMQPKIAETLFANEQIRDQGILSRVLVVQPDSLKGTRFLVEDEHHFNKVRRADEALACFKNRLKALLEIKPNVSKHDPQELAPRTLTLEKEARAHLIDFYNVVERLQLEGEVYSKISGFAGKAAEQAARIAGNLALFENPNATSVALSQMEVATVLMQFYLGEAVRIFDTGNVSSQVQEAQMLKNWLLTKWTEPLVDLTAINKFGPGSLRSTPAVKNLITMLEEYKWLVRVDERVRIKDRWSKRAYRINGR